MGGKIEPELKIIILVFAAFKRINLEGKPSLRQSRKGAHCHLV